MSLAYPGANALTLLIDDAIIASWNNEGLPSDAMSIENAGYPVFPFIFIIYLSLSTQQFLQTPSSGLS